MAERKEALSIKEQPEDVAGSLKVAFNPSANFAEWLAEQNISLAFTTYQANKLFLIGTQPDKRLSILERTLSQPMSLCASSNSQTLYVSSGYQVWRFENSLLSEQNYQGYDALYLPQVAYTTGHSFIQDMALTAQGQLVFANTLFSCLATLSETHSFKSLWQPAFITQLAPEDRCHLSGFALVNGEPRYATLFAQTDTKEGWRENYQSSGIVIDIEGNDIVCEGLSMPQTPRWYQDKLWLLESGAGYLGFIDRETGQFKRKAFCPGYARGLVFIDNYAIVTTSIIQDHDKFKTQVLEEQLGKVKLQATCGIHVIDLTTYRIIHRLEVTGLIQDIHDIALLPNVKNLYLVGFKSDEIYRMISIDQSK